jgi:hypothetical protein
MCSYERNRARIPREELQRHAGQWVAFSLDGSRILAGAENLPELEKRLATAGEDPEQVALERIEWEDSLAGGSELY